MPRAKLAALLSAALAIAALAGTAYAAGPAPVTQFAQADTATPEIRAARAACTGGTPERQIEFCTLLIDQGRQPADVLATAHYHRGEALYNGGKYAQALPDLTWLIDHNQGGVDLLIDRANALDSLGRLEEALADYAEAISRQPEYLRSYLQRAVAYRGAGQFELAFADLHAALRLEPANANIYVRFASIYDEIGDAEAALANMNHAIYLAPRELAYLWYRIDLNARLGKVENIGPDLCRIVGIDPRNDQARSAIERFSIDCSVSPASGH